MNACDLSSSGLTRGSSVLKTWMPDQVGHDSFEVFELVDLYVIPAKAGIHARKPLLLIQAWHDCQIGPA